MVEAAHRTPTWFQIGPYYCDYIEHVMKLSYRASHPVYNTVEFNGYIQVYKWKLKVLD